MYKLTYTGAQESAYATRAFLFKQKLPLYLYRTQHFYSFLKIFQREAWLTLVINI